MRNNHMKRPFAGPSENQTTCSTWIIRVVFNDLRSLINNSITDGFNADVISSRLLEAVDGEPEITPSEGIPYRRQQRLSVQSSRIFQRGDAG